MCRCHPGCVPDASIEYVWSHGEAVGAGLRCHYCNKSSKGGGATRFREHLAGIIGNVVVCQKVLKDVREMMNVFRVIGKARRRESKTHRLRVDDDIAQTVDLLTTNDYNCIIDIPSDEDEDMQIAVRTLLRDINIKAVTAGSRSSGSTSASCVGGSYHQIDRVFHSQAPVKKRGGFDMDLAYSRAPMQPRIDTMLSRDYKERVGKAWAK